jgi:hypothetical protein
MIDRSDGHIYKALTFSRGVFMGKAKSGAKDAEADAKKPPSKAGLLKSASSKVAKAAARLVKAAEKIATPKPPAEPAAEAKPKARAAKPGMPSPAKSKAATKEKAAEIRTVMPEKPRPRATKLPPMGEPLTKREMEQLLTAGAGRGVTGEGSLKGRLVVKDEFPYLLVVGRDKRELSFLLQGPDQEVLPAYLDHKVSVSGLVKKTTNYGGTVDVRKYSAKKPDATTVEPQPQEPKLRYLSPGEVEQVCNAGMGAGMKGFAGLRGTLEMTGEDFFLVVSNGGTRHQVSFLLEGKNAKGLRKFLAQTIHVTGVADKTSGWGGRLEVEAVEPRATEFKAVSRDMLEVVSVEGTGATTAAEVKLNHGLSVRVPERAGHTWAIEPTMAKRVGLREANFEPAQGGPGTREFFFTPRNPGTFEVEFFLAKAFTPAQVAKSFKLAVTVKP